MHFSTNFLYPLLGLFFLLPSCNKPEKSLNQNSVLSENWTLSNSSIHIPAEVPGSVQLNLHQNEIIKDPFYASNEKTSEWVELEEWTYETIFEISDLSFNYELIFKGLDTYSKIYINDVFLDRTDNMFRTWNYSIQALLKQGENKIKVTFLPTKPVIDSLYALLPYSLPYDSRVMVRKAPYQFGWDWGPSILPIGIHKPVVILKWDDFKLNHIQYYQKELNESNAIIQAKLEVEAENYSLASVKIKYQNKLLFKQKIQLEKGLNHVDFVFNIKNPQLWWPNGLGNAFLYELVCELEKSHVLIDSDTSSIGLRTVELITSKDKLGESFYFKVNGEPVFMKGANYIPSDVFIERTSSDKYAQLIQTAVESNFNMLRIWGGGIYEEDEFYNLCDQNGILIWQDFMFACALYPGDSSYLNNVSKEISETILRLRNHPSIALWCGNNEINEAWHHWGIQSQFSYTKDDSIRVWSDYQKLFNGLIPKVISDLDPERPYWESSPKYGWGNPKSMLAGDSHYWGVWWGEEPFEKYIEKTGRFMSEYGFQAHPNLNSIHQYIPKEEQYIGSESMKTHQKHPRGDELIDLYMSRDFPVPTEFDAYIYMSNLVQSYGMGMAIESHRRYKPYCMGTLYWQFNDCWPVTSWSGVDYFGNWKALQFHVKKLFEPLIISNLIEGDSIHVYIISDQLKPIDGKLSFEIRSFDDSIQFQDQKDIKLLANSSTIVYEMKLPIQIDYRSHYVKTEFTHSTNSHVETISFLEKPKNLNLKNVSPKFKLSKQDNFYELELFSDYFIKDLYVEIEGIDCSFSDNYFNLEPNVGKVINIYTKDYLTNNAISFKSLNMYLNE